MEIPYVDGQLPWDEDWWHYKTESKAQENPFVNGKNHGTAVLLQRIEVFRNPLRGRQKAWQDDLLLE